MRYGSEMKIVIRSVAAIGDGSAEVVSRAGCVSSDR